MSDTKPVSAAKRSVDYAEKELGVHDVYQAALTDRSRLDGNLTQVALKKDQKRDLEVKITDREMELSLEESGHHPEMSQAAMDRHLKQVLHKDDQLKDLKQALRWCVSDLEGLEFDTRVIETDIKIATARLVELGGYFNYLAAIKNAQHHDANKTSETGEAR